MEAQTNYSFSIIIKSFNITFEEQDDASFRIKTQYDDFSYEGSSFMKPIGKKGAEVLEKFLHYKDIEFETKHIKSDQSNSIAITIKHMILDEDIIILLRREEISDLTILKRDITKLRKEHIELEKAMTDDFKKQLIQQNKTITAIEKRISVMEDNIDFQIMMAKKIYVCYDGTDLHISDPALEKYLTDTIINKKFLLEETLKSGSTHGMTEQQWLSLSCEKSLKNLKKVFCSRLVYGILSMIRLILDSGYIITDITNQLDIHNLNCQNNIIHHTKVSNQTMQYQLKLISFNCNHYFLSNGIDYKKRIIYKSNSFITSNGGSRYTIYYYQ